MEDFENRDGSRDSGDRLEERSGLVWSGPVVEAAIDFFYLHFTFHFVGPIGLLLFRIQGSGFSSSRGRISE